MGNQTSKMKARIRRASSGAKASSNKESAVKPDVESSTNTKANNKPKAKSNDKRINPKVPKVLSTEISDQPQTPDPTQLESNEFDEILNETMDELEPQYTPEPSPAQSPSTLYIPKVKRIKDSFQYIKQLGSGGTCKVMLVSQNGKLLALKEMSKREPHNEEMFAKEVW